MKLCLNYLCLQVWYPSINSIKVLEQMAWYSLVSRYFHKWFDILYHKLSVFVSWPEHEQLLKTMPADFRKHFGKCAIIIDCFEIFIERPTSFMARAQTWSNYKKHNTAKFLIGITPQGKFCFISNGWDGQIHNWTFWIVTPPFAILGFNIQEAAGMYCAEVNIPPFTKGKKQLNKMEVDTACIDCQVYKSMLSVL